MRISFLYFDFGRVLCNFSHEKMCRQMAEVAGTTPERIEAVLFDDTLQYGFEAGAIDADEYYDRFCEQIGSRPNRADLELAANDIFEINQSIVPLVDRLAAAGIRLGVLSNTNVWHWEYSYDGRFDPLLPGAFETIVLSYEERSMKPDSVIFRAAIARAGVPANQIFFTDDREENVDGAIAVGIDAVRFEGTEQLIRELHKRGISGV